MNESNGRKVWFVTGASRGFGRVWVEAALARGDRVVATARDVGALSDLAQRYPQTALTLALDVTDRAAVFTTVERAKQHFGRLDVVASNAGFGLFGAIEEISEDEARLEMDTNFFGALAVLQATVPILRAQDGGHILITSSFGGLVNFATAGLYGASKYALEGLGEALALETADFGVKVTLIEPAAYATDFFGPSVAQATQMAAYDAARDRTMEAFKTMPPGDPSHTAEAILHVVDLPEPPLRLMLGEHALPFVRDRYAHKMAAWEAWSSLAAAAQ